jgi:hypothetical protein
MDFLLAWHHNRGPVRDLRLSPAPDSVVEYSQGLWIRLWMACGTAVEGFRYTTRAAARPGLLKKEAPLSSMDSDDWK